MSDRPPPGPPEALGAGDQRSAGGVDKSSLSVVEGSQKCATSGSVLEAPVQFHCVH